MSAPHSLQDRVRHCLLDGMTSREVMNTLAGSSTRNSVKATVWKVRKDLGLKATGSGGRVRKTFETVRLTEKLHKAFDFEAAERGITTPELVLRLLDMIVDDALVDAVLDDGAPHDGHFRDHPGRVRQPRLAPA